MENVFEFITRHGVLIGLIASVCLVLAAYIASSRFQFWVMDFWVKFPFIGPMRKWSKDITKADEEWMRSELALCSKYKPFCNLLTPVEFNKRTEYLKKAADLGRRPTPFWVLALLVVLVIAEGLGFSYLLGTWMAREGSANIHTVLMVAIVFVLCVILVTLTHFAGHQFYRTSLLRSCFRSFKEQGSGDYKVSSIKLDADQSVDNKDPEFQQIANRVAKYTHDKGSYAASWVTLVVVLLIAGISTYMRVQHLQGELIRHTAQTQSSPAASGNPFQNLLGLPEEILKSQNQADAQAHDEAQAALKGEGMAAFIILALIFIITQVVGMGAGYLYGFSGRESRIAWQELGGFSTYESYENYFRPRRDLANSRLKDLQQSLEQEAHKKLELRNTFDDYLNKLRKEQERREYEGRVEAASYSSIEPANIETKKTLTLQDVMNNIKELDDIEKEKAYFQTLPLDLRQNPELKAWLKKRKEEREALDADELF